MLCIILCINLAGCGKIDNSTLVPDNNKQEETTDTSKEEPSNNPSQNEIPEETPANEPDSDEVQIFNLSEDTPYDCFVASGGVLKAVDNENGEGDLILEGANVGYTVKRHLY